MKKALHSGGFFLSLEKWQFRESIQFASRLPAAKAY